MTTAYRIHPGTGIVLFQGGGLLRYHDWADTLVEALHAVGPGGVRRILSDRRAMSGPYPEGMEARVAEFFSGHGRELRDVLWAVVLSGQAGAWETVELTGRLSIGTGVRLRAFTDLPAALHWLLGVAYEEIDIGALETWIGA